MLLKEYKNNISNNLNGVWIKYNKGVREDAYKLWNSIVYQNTFWCTKNRITCIKQLCGGSPYKAGDFYVYYTNDKNDNPIIPRIAIRFEGNEIKEIRGVLDSSQNLEPSLTGIVKKKLDTFNLKIFLIFKIIKNKDALNTDGIKLTSTTYIRIKTLTNKKFIISNS